MNTQRNISITMRVYGFILILGILIAFQGSNFSFMKGSDVFTLDGDDFFESLNRKILSHDELTRKSYSSNFSKDDLSDIGDDTYNLIIFRLASNGYQVLLNDQFIGEFGDYKSGNSNLWNGINRIAIPKGLIKDHNTLTIKNHSHYMTGLTSHPIYITNSEKATKMLMRARLLNNYIVYISIGVSFLAIIVLWVLYKSSASRDSLYLYFSAAIFFLMIYAMDYSTFEYLFMPYEFYKKVIMVSFWLSTFFISYGLQRIFESIIPLVISAIGVLGIVLIAFFTPDLIAFKQLYSYWYFTQLITVISWLCLLVKNLRTSFEAQVFFSGFTILLFYGVINAVMDLSGVFFSMNSMIIYTSVVAIMPLLMLYLDYTQTSKDVREDVLTGAYNRRHLFSALTEKESSYSVAMFDIDNFKKINDAYGHQGGDKVLRFITESLRNHLRYDDMIFRYGGDEFVVVMDCPIDMMRDRMETFREYVEVTSIQYGMHSIKTTLSIGIFEADDSMSRQELLDCVDSAMYRAKKSGKNKVSL